MKDIVTNEMEGCSFPISLHITDPDFKFELPEGLKLKVTMPLGYPNVPAHVRDILFPSPMFVPCVG
jgi:hypothetical protein